MFAPANLGTTSRLVDFLVFKEKGRENNPILIFVATCVSAFLQTDQRCYVVPPLEWKAARTQSGVSEDCLWKLKEHFPGQRVPAHEWTEFAAKCLEPLRLSRIFLVSPEEGGSDSL